MCISGDSLAIVTICVQSSFPTSPARLKVLKRYVYLKGKVADYAHLRHIWKYLGFKVLASYVENRHTIPFEMR
jgi:hypothetical protein